MKFLKMLAIALIAVGVPSTALLAQANDIGYKKLGFLSCEVAGGWGLLVGSRKRVDCTYKNLDGHSENYKGFLNKLGLDIGKTEAAYMKWVVYTSVDNVPGRYALAGKYVGVSGEVSLGVGLGAKALIGGSNDSIGLQPISVEGIKGVNLALGIANLNLRKK